MGTQSVSVVQTGLKSDCQKVILSVVSRFGCCEIVDMLMDGIVIGCVGRIVLFEVLGC